MYSGRQAPTFFTNQQLPSPGKMEMMMMMDSGCSKKIYQVYVTSHKTVMTVILTFSLTFSNEDGDTTEKHTRNTSVCG
jgi:hypothetical protein